MAASINVAQLESKIAELSALLREAEKLGLRFDIGNAYIRRVYIDHQTDLVARINAALAGVTAKDVPPVEDAAIRNLRASLIQKSAARVDAGHGGTCHVEEKPDAAQADLVQTIVAMAARAHVTYKTTKEWTTHDDGSCMTIRVPVALLHRIIELGQLQK